MTCVIKIIGMAAGITTAWDDQYLVEYDPALRPINIIQAHLVTSPNVADAMRFIDTEHAYAFWNWSRGVRKHDGKPDKPLVAFNVLVEPVEQGA